MNRRLLLGAMLAAPAIIRGGVLMPIWPRVPALASLQPVGPPEFIVTYLMPDGTEVTEPLSLDGPPQLPRLARITRLGVHEWAKLATPQWRTA